MSGLSTGFFWAIEDLVIFQTQDSTSLAGRRSATLHVFLHGIFTSSSGVDAGKKEELQAEICTVGRRRVGCFSLRFSKEEYTWV